MRIFTGANLEQFRKEEKYLNSIVRYAWENNIPLEGIDGLSHLQ